MTAVLAPKRTPMAGPTQPQPQPQPFRWTVEQYRDLAKTGQFHDAKTMLIDGEVYVMVMPKPPHDFALGLTDDWLRTVFAVGHHIRNQMGFVVGTANDPGPDLAVIRGTRADYAGRTPTEAVMIVEVADSSLFFDVTTKAELYATAGVPEYWVIDLEHRELIVFRDPQRLVIDGHAYRTKFTRKATDVASPLAAPHASVTVSDLLPP